MSMHWNETEPGVARTMNRKKKTGKWCKGKVGVEHVTMIVRNHNTLRSECRWYPARYLRSARLVVGVYSWRYTCFHASQCIKCGKYVAYFLPAEQCPNFKPREES